MRNKLNVGICLKLEAGKAFAKINPDKGYRMDIINEFCPDAYDGRYAQSG